MTNEDLQKAFGQLATHVQQLTAEVRTQPEQPPRHVCVAMEFIVTCQRLRLPIIAMRPDDTQVIPQPEMRPSELAAFDAACDALYDYFTKGTGT